MKRKTEGITREGLRVSKEQPKERKSKGSDGNVGGDKKKASGRTAKNDRRSNKRKIKETTDRRQPKGKEKESVQASRDKKQWEDKREEKNSLRRSKREVKQRPDRREPKGAGKEKAWRRWGGKRK